MNFLQLHPQPLPGTAKNQAITTTSAALALSAGKAFRLVSDVACHIRQSKAAASKPATTGDMFMPAGSPLVILMGDFDEITCRTQSGSGTLGAVQVQNPI